MHAPAPARLSHHSFEKETIFYDRGKRGVGGVGSGGDPDHGQAEQSEPDNLESGRKVPADQQRTKTNAEKVSFSLSRVN